MRTANKNAMLVERIKSREGSGEFGYGFTTADRYVQEAMSTVGRGELLAHFRCLGQGIDNVVKLAGSKLTYCGEGDVTGEVKETSVQAMAKLLGSAPPAHAMMAFVNVVTTPREDRDGDTLQTAGAKLDPKAPLLWQHIHTLPIGKMVRMLKHDAQMLKVATVLLDLNELTSDAAKLIEAEVLRISHGFIPHEFEERKGGGMARFNVLAYDIVEESLVSIPSNVDAEIELFSRGKLASSVFKAHAKALFDNRVKMIPVTEKAKLTLGMPAKEPASKPASKAGENIMRKMFDVATERVQPNKVEYEWASRYIGCAVKDLHVHTTGASGMMIGSFLAGLEATTADMQVTDTRNLDDDGSEHPPVFETIDIKSSERRSFMVEGLRFCKGGTAGAARKIVYRTWAGWGQQMVAVYADTCEGAQKVIDDAWEWVRLNNPLKGEAFSLAGQWLTKNGTSWEDVFLDKPIEDSLKRRVRIINEKGADAANCGLILKGPPGTGKTLSARVMLNEADATFIWVSAKDFWQFGAYHGFSGAFSLARELAPSIICFEDVDNWIDSYSVDLLKGEMDGIEQSSGVTTILTTNFPDQLPAALIDRPGRFHESLEIHLPKREVRLRMLEKWAADATPEARAKMAEESDGYSGAHLYHLCAFASVLRDEDKSTMDDALVKAFTHVKEQRESINQSQLAGSSYRPSRREMESAIRKGLVSKSVDRLFGEPIELEFNMPHILKGDGGITAGIIGPTPNEGEAREDFMARCILDPSMMDNYPTVADRVAACKVQAGKAAQPAVKQLDEEAGTGTCKGCEKEAELNADGYCAKCAEEPAGDKPKGAGGMRTKAGRVLSQKNYESLKEASDKIQSVLKSAEPAETEPTNKPDEPAGPPLEQTTTDAVLQRAVELVSVDRKARDRMRSLLDAFDKVDEEEQMAEEFRAVAGPA